MKGKQSIKSMGALLLSLVLLFQTGTAFAESGTVSENKPAGEVQDVTISENELCGSEEPESEEKAQESDLEEAEEAVEDTVSGQSLQEIQAGATTPENPVHYCTKENYGSDYTEFSYVYFGSYPKGIVRDSALIAAIDRAIATSGTAADAGTDVWVNGAKYRRISKNDTNDDCNFDEVKNNGYRYFKWERIKWKVLKNDGKTLFVVADNALDCKQYNEERENITWETSTIRNWLNTVFYSTAFSRNEQNAIVEQTIGTSGNNTNDKVYLLSREEVTNKEYGFCSYSDVYSVSRRMQASGYANARGVFRYKSSSSIQPKDECEWWLRSPSNYGSDGAALVDNRGVVSSYFVECKYCGVCPALHINLSSALWSMTDDGTSGSGGEKKKAPEEVGQTKVTKLMVTAPSAKLAAGKNITLSLQVFPQNAANKAVSFQSSNSKYASVDQKGKVTVKKAGIGKNVTITATALDGSQVKASCKFRIMKHAVKKISLKAPKKTLKAGKTMTIKASVKTTGKSVNKSLKWVSSNKKYATVNSKGKVTAKKAGKGKTVTITAESTDGSNKKATVKIKIK